MRRMTLCLLGVALACGKRDARNLPNEDQRSVADSVSQPDSTRAQPIVRASSESTVLIIGTSLTAGLGLDPYDAYPGVLQRMADSAGYRVDVVAAGVSGETSAGALRRIDWLLQKPADVIVVETGANDGLRGLDIDSTRTNLREILRRSAALKPNARLFLVQMEAPPNLGPRYTTSFRAMFPEVAREAHAELIPFLLDGVAGVPDLNQPDGIHPNERGSVVVAGNVWRTLEPALRQLGER
ncbi:MAG TPA: arylesterase [Gemmatimonadaceae bacterium]|nr:arylesterase [Gemmatimonadaceae bacterium]